jgi:hypothetical protein
MGYNIYGTGQPSFFAVSMISSKAAAFHESSRSPVQYMLGCCDVGLALDGPLDRASQELCRHETADDEDEDEDTMLAN